MFPCSYNKYKKEKKYKTQEKLKSKKFEQAKFNFNINMNLLENPIWFSSRNTSEVNTFVGEEYDIESSMGMLDYFDITILYYLFSKLEKKSYVNISIYSILKDIGITPSKKYYERVFDAIKRLMTTTINYKRNWIHVENGLPGREYRVCMFTILTSVISSNIIDKDEIDKEKLCISFNDLFIKAVENSIYYTKNIDFNFFRFLKHPTAARLYEYLVKQFVFNNKYPTDVPITHEKIADKIALSGKKRNGKEVLYDSMIRDNIIDAVKKINAFVADEKKIREYNVDINKVFAIKVTVDDNGFIFEKVLPEYVLKTMPEDVKNDPEFNNPAPIIIDRTKKVLFLGGPTENKTEEKIEEKKKEEIHNDIY